MLVLICSVLHLCVSAQSSAVYITALSVMWCASS